MTTIPGIKAAHAIITPTCRLNRGDSGALAEAFARVQKEYEDIVSARSDQFVCHVALIVEDAIPVSDGSGSNASSLPETKGEAVILEQQAWFIERGDAGQLEYFKQGSGESAMWTPNWHEAMAYPDERTARFGTKLRKLKYDRIAEHSWEASEEKEPSTEAAHVRQIALTNYVSEARSVVLIGIERSPNLRDYVKPLAKAIIGPLFSALGQAIGGLELVVYRTEHATKSEGGSEFPKSDTK